MILFVSEVFIVFFCCCFVLLFVLFILFFRWAYNLTVTHNYLHHF